MSQFNLAQVLRSVCQTENEFLVIPAGKVRPPTKSAVKAKEHIRLAAHGLQFIKEKGQVEALVEGLSNFSRALVGSQTRSLPILAFLSWKNKVGMVLPTTPGSVFLQYKLFGQRNASWSDIQQITAFTAEPKYSNYFYTDVKVRLEDLRVQESQVPIFRFVWRDAVSAREEESCWFIQINGGVSYSSALAKYFSNMDQIIPVSLLPFATQERKRPRPASSSEDSESKKRKKDGLPLYQPMSPEDLDAIFSLITASQTVPAYTQANRLLDEELLSFDPLINGLESNSGSQIILQPLDEFDPLPLDFLFETNYDNFFTPNGSISFENNPSGA